MRAKRAASRNGYRIHQRAVNHMAAINLNRFKRAGQGIGRAKGGHDQALLQPNFITCAQIAGDGDKFTVKFLNAGLMPASSRARIAPICAQPRATPPPSARPNGGRVP